MSKPRWLLALPVALALAVVTGNAFASDVRDTAGLFGRPTVKQAQADLSRIERESQVGTTIETIDSLDGKIIGDVSERLAEESGTHGLYVLISKKEKALDLRVSSKFSKMLNTARTRNIRQAFITGFRKGDYDAGLLDAVKTLDREVSAAKSAGVGIVQPRGARPKMVPIRAGNPRGSFGIGSLLGIGLAIIAVLFVVRLVGSLFGAGRSYGSPMNRMGGMGGPGGPGYGYGGGGGGGFMSSLFGGIGGALAGNWLYDQFSGRSHGSYNDSSTYDGGTDPGPGADAGAEDYSGGTHVGGDWGSSETGGGDWGGGGGDWGGGGGGDAGTGGDW